MKNKKMFFSFIIFGTILFSGMFDVNAATWQTISCNGSGSTRQVTAKAIDDRWITKGTSVSCGNSLAEAIARVKCGNEAVTAETTEKLRSVTALMDCYDSHSHSFKGFYG